MATLIITVTGDRSDLDYLRPRLEGLCLDVVSEEESHLDEPVMVDIEIGEGE